MADYAIGLSMHKANRTIVRAVDLRPPSRYFAQRSDAGFITLPTLAAGDNYVEIQGISQANFSVNDEEKTFRLLGDDGWADSVITGSRVQANCTGYFLKDAEIPAGSSIPQFRGDYEDGFRLIEKARYNKDYEIYIEFMLEMGQANGDSGDWVYDYTGFNAVVMNYKPNLSAETLTEVTFDLMSRGRPVFGRYNAGPNRLAIGAVQSSLLFLVNGTRQAATVPANNAIDIAVGANVTVTYTSNGSTALTELALAGTGGGFKLRNLSSGIEIPAVVGLASNVVTINPNADLPAATMFQLVVEDGAILQAVDANGVASPSGTLRPIQGFTSTFRTA
jgi:hypothetical protein